MLVLGKEFPVLELNRASARGRKRSRNMVGRERDRHGFPPK